MSYLKAAVDLFLHLDKHLGEIIQSYGTWTYAILFGIVFAETGFVITPFLPGDSLLFAAGAFAGLGKMRLEVVLTVLIVAAVLGDTVNYWIGQFLGHKLLAWGKLIKREHVERTHKFFEKYGGKTIIIARFVPIVRTFAPFVAGIGTMNYSRFLAYNVIGGVLWVVICVGAGYLFGGMEFVKKNFSLVVLAIIAISVMPMVYEYIRHRREVAAALRRGPGGAGDSRSA